MPFYQYKDSHYDNKMLSSLSYLYNQNTHYKKGDFILKQVSALLRPPKRSYILAIHWLEMMTQGMVIPMPSLSTGRLVNYSRADSRFVPSQWEMALLCNDVSHWLSANLELALLQVCFIENLPQLISSSYRQKPRFREGRVLRQTVLCTGSPLATADTDILWGTQ